jgi:peptidoglycan/xylan/chitin deacetylase (PgdA/CDA1 family)
LEAGAALAFPSAVWFLLAYLAWIYLPDVDWPRRRRGRPGRGRVAITFDDGPGPDTAKILEVLERHRARATFFCVGREALRFPELIDRMTRAGHLIGNHTLEHRKLAWLSPTEVRRQIDAAQEALERAGAPRPRWFRAPHGFKSPFLPRVLRRAKLELVAWTHGVWDTDRPGAVEIARRAISKLDDGDILLLHDGGGDRSQTADALDAILSYCERQSLTPVTIAELHE